MYRLAADIFNDTAMVIDCLSPAFPKPLRVVVLSFSSVLRALCGVCAGSAKASLSAHFARKGNLGEVNAVSHFRETLGMFRMCSPDMLERFLLKMKTWGGGALHLLGLILKATRVFSKREQHRHVWSMF